MSIEATAKVWLQYKDGKWTFAFTAPIVDDIGIELYDNTQGKEIQATSDERLNELSNEAVDFINAHLRPED